MRISVIGTGYLGAVHAACMAELGHEVLGVDNDARKIAALAEGRAPFYEPGLSEILVRTVGPGNCGSARRWPRRRRSPTFISSVSVLRSCPVRWAPTSATSKR